MLLPWRGIFWKILCFLIKKTLYNICIKDRFSVTEEPMLEISNCYKLLRLDEDCSDLELRRRFRKCAMATHPDRLKLSPTLQDIPQQAFVRFNEAYKRIVSYRKQLIRHQKESVNAKRGDFGSEPKGFNLNEIRERLAKINASLFEASKPEGTNSYGFNSEIDRIYEQHMNIMDSLGDRLRQMRGK
jgi:curved DNA-binding protein CbpA